MSKNNIYLSKEDHRVLSHLLRGLSAKVDTVFRLRAELTRAIVLEADEVPDEAIGLGSQVEIEDIETGEREAYTLTLPSQSDFDQGKLSILTPIGAGLLGYEEGDEIEWPTPGGLRRIRVLSVHRTSDVLSG
ncbi:GreA/GreB family elongation factor [Coraliomargarita sp. W4R53]